MKYFIWLMYVTLWHCDNSRDSNGVHPYGMVAFPYQMSFSKQEFFSFGFRDSV